MSSPQIGKFDQSATITWSNGAVFNGYIIVGIVIPTQNGMSITVWPQINYGNTAQQLYLPKGFAKVPIVEGKLFSNAGLIYNIDINPPATQYVYYVYDSSNKQIAGPSSFFTVSSPTITLPSLTLVVPTQTGSVAPVPGN
jgi:hypothetical protein